MGQGLGMVQRIGAGTQSDANSTSFYSQHTSVNLNNSRYLLQGRDNKIMGPPTNVGKVMPPIMKSIDNAIVYGSHTSNFQQHDPMNNVRNSSYPMQNDGINKMNQIHKFNNSNVSQNGSNINQSSFYSSQAHSIHNGNVPIGSANYEKIQAKYAISKEFTSSYRPLNGTTVTNHPYEQNQMPASNGPTPSPFDEPQHHRHHRPLKPRDRSIDNDVQLRGSGHSITP